MSTIVVDRSVAAPARPRPPAEARVALLGCGNVGRAFTLLAAAPPSGTRRLRITGALVRDIQRTRPLPVPALTADARQLWLPPPDVCVELLGGLEPARRLVLEALARGIPVVTANKSLLARHGGELRDTARTSGTPLLYEAAVIAGVPFLGTFSRRPRAAAVTGLVAIANGTSNFVLSRCARDGCGPGDALAEAQRLGYAEPDPRSDVSGTDACEKLVVLLQHFAHVDVSPDVIETSGLDAIGEHQPSHARELGGVIKPVIVANWHGATLEAFVGPAFVTDDHPLSRVDGVENAIVLSTPHGRLRFQGPGAGPEVTAATVLDDVEEALSGVAAPCHQPLTHATVVSPETGWLVTLEGARLPAASDVADLLASHGLFAHRVTATHTHGGRESRSLLLRPAGRPVLQRALDAVCAAAGCTPTALRALEDAR
ncbi:MAG: homoserine dehydrogenase [Vicinamibacterales bacterium]